MSYQFYFSLLCLSAFATFLPKVTIANCPVVPPPDNETLEWLEIPTIDDYCFLFDFRAGREMDYSAAQSYCETFVADDNSKARVVEPRTAALQQAITSYASLFGGKSMWGGFNDFSEGNWKWASGDSVVYENWSSGQPDNTYDSDCMNIADYYGYYWDDVQCDSTSLGYPIFAACQAPLTNKTKIF